MIFEKTHIASKIRFKYKVFSFIMKINSFKFYNDPPHFHNGYNRHFCKDRRYRTGIDVNVLDILKYEPGGYYTLDRGYTDLKTDLSLHPIFIKICKLG